ncbi:cation transporter [Spirochaeta africana]|uniref:Cation transport ATPase n=1 Tax=Spirochaeta africana (strain ATCC 700263 / DSM 8902 / Z-7692) TaxID=889378 RepID=H9UI91_SPIAZ|nr:cation transporter [Spirochaeta africana]AFG37234.1 cation transport ATPase [Spirochaeta africana DSM 8902]
MNNERTTAILDVDGATCTSCVYTIEHVGKRIKGVNDVYVDRASHQIQLDYDGNPDTVEKLITVVQRIGYNARLQQ